MPIKFTVMTTLAVAVASLLELIPTFVIRSNVPTIATVTPYTPLELAGRDLYVSEGCYNCHSQMIRPTVAETKRYGEYSKPGESVYDHPFQWGSRRIGPDLAREGGKQSHQWHVLHFRNPQQFNEGSIMPAYPWLMRKELDFESIPLRIAAMQTLGVPYPEYEGLARDQAKADAEVQAKQIAQEYVEQTPIIPGTEEREGYIDTRGQRYDLADKQVIALIAYIQRIGTDLFKTPDESASEEGAETPSEAANPPTVSSDEPADQDARTGPNSL